MSLLLELTRALVISGAMLAALVVLVIGPYRFTRSLRQWHPRVIDVLPYLVVLVGILLLRAIAQEYFEEMAWLIDVNITGWIFAVEGDVITYLQALAHPALTAFFGFMYIYGYIVLIVFPVLAYFVLPSMDHLKELLTAYILNYAVGVVLYVVFIAYGPRNLGWDFVAQPLYEVYPESALITGMVNVPINVFPSLHTSIAVTAFLLAYRTRRIYPLWTIVAGLYGGAVVISTMYLGIHWVSDVIAGILLAALAVYLAVGFVEGRPPMRGNFTKRPHPGPGAP